MKRKIIKIDQTLCDGCGLCAEACHEGAIGIREGKAVLLRDDYCDGLGDCLPACPTGAISFEEREALPYEAAAVLAKQAAEALPCGCPGTHSKKIIRSSSVPAQPTPPTLSQSKLMQWPVQIQLVPVAASYFDNANLLIAADCTAYAYGNFHEQFMRNHVTLIGCPKLDSVDYAEKLTQILQKNTIKSVQIVRMEVPCCGGIEAAAKTALQNSGKMIPWSVYTVTTAGELIEN